MVSTVDHVATCAGVDLLRKGGTAADAAVGANAVLAVTSPHMCGLGGDMWALVHDGSNSPPAALDGAGFAGSGADAQRLRSAGHRQIPVRGHVAAVTVPGAVDGWLALHARYGRLTLGDVLAEAVRIAQDGFAASPLLAERAGEVAEVKGNTDIPGGLLAGAVVRRPGTARALRAVIKQGRDGFYGGEFGEGLLALGAGAPGDAEFAEFTEADLAVPVARWVDPLRVEAFGHVLWTVPPTSQGYLTLAGAWIAHGLDLGDTDDGRWAHLLVEAASQAGHDRMRELYEGADGQALVDPSRLAPRRVAIAPDRAANLVTPAAQGDTQDLEMARHLRRVDPAGGGDTNPTYRPSEHEKVDPAGGGDTSGWGYRTQQAQVASAGGGDTASAERDAALGPVVPAAQGDTTYLCAVDGDGMGVSLINSNASGFGAHLVAGTTGIFLHDRGIGFNLIPGHPAEYTPGRRPPHTLSPALVTHPDGSLRQVLGTMGGDSQPQILLQLLARTLRLGQSAGRALRAARWVLCPDDDPDSGFATWHPGHGRRVLVEDPATGWHESLAARGHATSVLEGDPHRFGHAHLIEVTRHGTLAGAADPRSLIGAAAGL